MQYRLLAALCIGAAVLLSGCGKEGTQNSEAAEIPVYQALPLPVLKLDIPETFSETSSEFYEKYYICNDASIIITEDTEGPFTSAYDYSISALRQYQETASTVEVLSQEVVIAKNCDVQVLEFRYTLGDNAEADLTAATGFMTDGESMYIITCKSNTDTYPQYRDAFYTVMRSVMNIKTGR